MTFMDALVAEAAALQPPDGAFSISDFIARPEVNMTRVMAKNFLKKKVREGVLKVGRFTSVTGGRPQFYWPAK